MLVGWTGWNGLLDEFGLPIKVGGVPTILALGKLGKLLGDGYGLIPCVGRPLEKLSRRNNEEKLNLLDVDIVAGATTVLMSTGLNVMADGGGPPRRVEACPGDWAWAGAAAMARQTAAPIQVPVRMIPLLASRGKTASFRADGVRGRRE
jgi:hypothetical protein